MPNNKRLLDKLNRQFSNRPRPQGGISISVGGGGRSRISGQDPGGATRPIEVDENGNLRVDLVSGIAVSTEINSTVTLDVKQVSGSVDSINVLQFGGTAAAVNSGVTGAGVLRVVHVTDVALSSQVTGPVAHDSPVSGNPILNAGEARTTNPTAVADGDVVRSMHDDLGRIVSTPYQVRDLVSTAQAATSTLAEVTLIAGVASTFLDLVEITCANNTGAAIRVSVRDATGGGIVKTFNIPANNTIQQTFPVPVPQNTAAAAWTIQNAGSGDISTTDVTVSALFIKNV